MITEKDLNYWKTNAEEDYKQVPISVLKYITELETVVKNCSMSGVVESPNDAFDRGFTAGLNTGKKLVE